MRSRYKTKQEMVFWSPIRGQSLSVRFGNLKDCHADYSAYLSASAGGIRAALLAEPKVVRSASPYAKAMISSSDIQGITNVNPEPGLVAIANPRSTPNATPMIIPSSAT